MRLAGFSLCAAEWQPLADGQWQPLKAIDFSLDADQISWQGWHLGSLQLEGKSRDGVVSVVSSKGRLQGGNMEAAFDWNTHSNSLRFSSLMLQNQRLELASAPALPWQQIELSKGTLNDVTLVGPQGPPDRQSPLRPGARSGLATRAKALRGNLKEHWVSWHLDTTPERNSHRVATATRHWQGKFSGALQRRKPQCQWQLPTGQRTADAG